ncbi:MAG: Mur ligase family protein [Chitinophagaceae bacterium]
MKVHFIAIGGSVMHQLAISLKQKGYGVTGSDDEIFQPARDNLDRNEILPPSEGWYPEKITSEIDAVILGMHARADNEELKKAGQLGLRVYSFPEYIFEESRDKKRVVIGGSHGKTTTTSMIMHVLRQTAMRFDYLVGAKLQGFEQSVNVTDAPVIVCEGDEYPASAIQKRPKFHFLFPHIAVITGIAWDHVNVFPTFENYLEQFQIFIDKIQPGGLLIYNQADSILKKLVDNHPGDVKKIPYYLPEHHIVNGQTHVRLEGHEAALNVFGDHNLLNLNAAYLVCKELGVQADKFLEAIAQFRGAARRLELVAQSESLTIYRDFAHAPSKVKATIEAMKQQFPGKKLIALLELHTYSSLSIQFMNEYRGAMELADRAAVYYSKHALALKRMPALPRQAVIDGFAKEGLMVLNEKDELTKWLLHHDFTNANLLLMSSGNYDGLDIITFVNNNKNEQGSMLKTNNRGHH